MAATVRHVINPTDKEVETCTDVIYESFGRRDIHEYGIPVFFLSALGNDEALVRPFVRAQIMTGFIGGEIHVVEVADAGIVGVAMWFGPGQKFLLSPEQRAAGWDDIMNKVGETRRQWWNYFLRLLSDVQDKYYGAGVHLDSYHLKLIGVRPQYQKKGYGTVLFRFVEPRAAAESKSTVVETLENSAVPFYRALGYTVFGPDDIKTPNGQDTVPGYWFQKKFAKGAIAH